MHTNPPFNKRITHLLHLPALLSLPLLLGACVSTRYSGESAIASNPWRTNASSAVNAQSTLPATTRAFYVDCQNGNDTLKGDTPEQAWKTISRANRAVLEPGSALLLKRGCTFAGPLEARWTGRPDAPVLIGAYGEGTLPRIHVERGDYVVLINGRHQILQHLEVSATKPGNNPALWRCREQANGWRTGFSFQQPGEHNVVRHARASGLTAGIHFHSGKNNKALHNVLVHNNVMSQNTPSFQRNDDDSGAWGVLLNADDNEVAYNYFEGNVACSEDYGVEGASVEVFKASNNSIHHNVSVNDSTFAELGGSPQAPSKNNTFAYNLYAPVDTGGQFLVVRGEKSKWGGNPGTKFHNNTGYLVTLGISCSDGCSRDILSARNNILWARDANQDLLFTDAPFDESNNLLWHSSGKPRLTLNGVPLSPTTKIANPKFLDPANLDFRLAPDSPGVSSGSRDVIGSLGMKTDLQGKPLSTDQAPDVGALQSRR